jgi:hypothetical protein
MLRGPAAWAAPTLPVARRRLCRLAVGGGSWFLRPATVARGFLPLGAGADHGQRDALPLFVDAQHPDTDDVADGSHFVRITDEAVGHAADEIGRAHV